MRQLAARIDVTHPYLSKRFGYAADFTLTDVERLAAELGTTPADLLADGQTYWDDFHENRAAGTIPGEGQTWEEFSKWKLVVARMPAIKRAAIAAGAEADSLLADVPASKLEGMTVSEQFRLAEKLKGERGKY